MALGIGLEKERFMAAQRAELLAERSTVSATEPPATTVALAAINPNLTAPALAASLSPREVSTVHAEGPSLPPEYYTPRGIKRVWNSLASERQRELLKDERIRAARFPFIDSSHRLIPKTVAEAEALLTALGGDTSYFSEETPGSWYNSLAFKAFKTGYRELAEYFLEKSGGSFIGIEHCLMDCGDHSFFEYPHLSLAIRKERLAQAIESNTRYPGELRMNLMRMLMDSCRMGSAEGLAWVLANARQHGVTFSKEEMVPALKEAIYLGSEDVVRVFARYLNFSTLSGSKQELVDLCIERGYPELLPILNLPISRAQAKELEKLKAILARVAGRADVEPPRPINAIHARVHGGDANLAIYEREYRRGVAALVYYKSRADYNPEKEIELSGYLRKRQAILGGQKGRIQFGKPTSSAMGTTYDDPNTPGAGAYSSFGEKIRAMYGDALPVQGELSLEGTPRKLSKITKTGWVHPSGEDRPVILGFLGRLLGMVHSEDFSADAEGTQKIMQRLSAFYWTMAQHPMFDRGNPTALAMNVDATLLSKGRTALYKRKTDVNCEALCYMHLVRFREEIFMDLPRPAIVP